MIEFNLFNKSYNRIQRYMLSFPFILMGFLIVMGIIQSSNNSEQIVWITSFFLLSLLFSLVIFKSEKHLRNNKIVLDENSISFRGNKKSAYCHYNNVAYILVVPSWFKNHFVVVRSIKEDYNFRKNNRDLPYPLLRVYSHYLITDDFIFFTYNKEALGILKKYCNAPIYDEYILYRDGVENAL